MWNKVLASISGPTPMLASTVGEEFGTSARLCAWALGLVHIHLAHIHIERAQEFPLSDLNALLAQQIVGGGDVEIEVWDCERG